MSDPWQKTELHQRLSPSLPPTATVLPSHMDGSDHESVELSAPADFGAADRCHCRRKYRHPEAKCLRSCLTCHDQRNHRNHFPGRYISVIDGGRTENQALLRQKFDKILFTGSKAVGKEVLRHAAENLTPVTLELGGKSPCIVDSTAKIPLAARRIVFGKFLNCGQTCVAPDYILCHHSVRQNWLLRSGMKSRFSLERVRY